MIGAGIYFCFGKMRSVLRKETNLRSNLLTAKLVKYLLLLSRSQKRYMLKCVLTRTVANEFPCILIFIHVNDSGSPVGDFAPVTSVFSHYELGNTVSPFLLLDHLGIRFLKPTQLKKWVLEHPYRGFEVESFSACTSQNA